ncbi:MAG: TIGR04211 family SH3 domain-containing protein [Gammaproteobacteria bacterium]|nr:TIGR04211 family SH3 domain-containing protein [Gammaproteobacteria bacterium]
MMRLNIILLFITLVLTHVNALAQTKYVSDQLSINMRSDKGVQFKITKILKSGTPVEVLNTDKAGYTQVKTSNGSVGWVLTRFLQNNEVARVQYQKAFNEIKTLKEENQILKHQLDKLNNEHSTLLLKNKELSELSENQGTEIIKLKKIAARPMQLERNNEQLRKDILSNEAQTRIIKQELQTVKEDNDKEWFITGAIVLFGGIILGLILPKMRSRQRSQSWSRLN